MNLNLFTNYATSVHTFSLSFWNLRIHLIYSNLFYNVISTFLDLLTLLNFLNLLDIFVLHFPCHPRTGIPCATAWRNAACVATPGIRGPCAVRQRWMGGRRSKNGWKNVVVETNADCKPLKKHQDAMSSDDIRVWICEGDGQSRLTPHFLERDLNIWGILRP